jgi:hypothetical protein
MKHYFFSSSSYVNFKESLFNTWMDIFLTELQSSTVGNIHGCLKVVPVGDKLGFEDSKFYEVTLKGMHVFTIVRRSHSILVSYSTPKEYQTYNNKYSYNITDSYNMKTPLGIRIVDMGNFNVSEHAISFCNVLRNQLIAAIMKNFDDKHYEVRGLNDNSVIVDYEVKIESSKLDSRYCEFKKLNDNVRERFVLGHNEVISYDEFITEMENIKQKAETKLNVIYADYQNIKDVVGGVTLVLDKTTILCHKSFRPIITGGFITYKCPYTNRTISMKSSNYDVVIVDGFEEIYGNDTTMLIGNN